MTDNMADNMTDNMADNMTDNMADNMTDNMADINTASRHDEEEDRRYEERFKARIEAVQRVQREMRRDMERQRVMMQQPFLDERLLTDDNPPNCALAAFKEPQLRKCPFDFDGISYVGKINQHLDMYDGRCDGGLDGWNWKVKFDGVSGGPFVLKLFWDSKPPEPPLYFAAQRECQNAALLQQIEEALRPENAPRGPIRIFPVPRNRVEARANLMAFCDEQRAVQKPHEKHECLEEVTSMPRLRKCYGWMKVTIEQLEAKISPRRWPHVVDCGWKDRYLQSSQTEFFANVYEYIEEADNVAEKLQETLDFLLNTGFSDNGSPLPRNWKNSILIDFSEYSHVGGNGWCVPRRLRGRGFRTL